MQALGYRFALARTQPTDESALLNQLCINQPIALDQLSFDQPVALVFGGNLGVGKALLDACDVSFNLQLPGLGSSPGLPASVGMSASVALTIHWAWMQRTAALRSIPGGLNEAGGDLDSVAVAKLYDIYASRGRGFKRDHRRATARLGHTGTQSTVKGQNQSADTS